MERRTTVTTGGVQIVDFSPLYAADFQRLNEEWLRAFFHVEELDANVLGDPQGMVIDLGGEILFALLGDEVVGTVALKAQGRGRFELTKMAVTASAQGGGIGQALLLAAIERFAAREGEELYLETHSSLKAAISLYERAGFEHREPAEPSKYARADVYMVYCP